MRSLFFAALLSLLCSSVAQGHPPFDATKRAVLPSEAAALFLERHRTDGDWSTSGWAISQKDIDRLESVLAVALRKADDVTHIREFYRQYMPVRWKTFHVIVVNGFRLSASDMFSDRGIPRDLWRHELFTVFGGGCGYWYTLYVVEQNRLMVFPDDEARHKGVVVCNAIK